MFDLSGKTALITGASSGLGKQFAQCLTKAGARVILAARRFKELKILADEIGNSFPIEMNVNDKNLVQKAFEELESNNEKIDICINNAGIAMPTPIFQNTESDDFENIIQTNTMGVWYVTKAIAIHMKQHGIHGSIINIGSINGAAIPAKEGAAYSISKAAVIHLTKTLVGELSPHKIRINCISPGLFRTPMNRTDVASAIPYIPCGEIANPKEIDGLILYLASNKASKYATGSCFTIDGGASWGGKADVC